ncbi:DUF11 domain-containing protein [Streptomyces sp. JNUCC 64]
MRRTPGRRPVPAGRPTGALTTVGCALGAGLLALASPLAAPAAGAAGTPDGATGTTGPTRTTPGATNPTRTAPGPHRTPTGPDGTPSRTGPADGSPRPSGTTAHGASHTHPRGRADLAVGWGPAPGPSTPPGTTGTTTPDGPADTTNGAAAQTGTHHGPGGAPPARPPARDTSPPPATAAPGTPPAPGSAPPADPTGRPPRAEAATTAAHDPTYTYRVFVVNHGPSQAVDVVVTDRLPDSLVFVSADGCTADGRTVTCGPLATLDVGATHTWLLTVRPADDYTGDGSDITNTAVVTSGTEDPDSANNTATHTGVPVPDGTGKADLALAKTSVLPPGRTDAVRPGDRFAYRLTVRNHGPATAVGVQVTDPLPAVLGFVSSPDGCRTSPEHDRTVVCPVRDRLPAGASVTYELLVRVREDVTRGGGGGGGGGHAHHRRCEIENTAHVTALTRDPVPANNSNRPGTTGPGGGPLYLERPANGPHQPPEPHHPPRPDTPDRPHDPGRPHTPDQLAETGRDVPDWLPWTAALTLTTGGALVLLSRRHRHRAPGKDTRP